MPKLILSIDGVVIKEFELVQERTTLGRRPHNDIVIDHLAVSGEHAMLHWVDGVVVLQDLDSTNGSYVNGKPVKRQPLASGDLLEIGRHQIRFLDNPGNPGTPGQRIDKSNTSLMSLSDVASDEQSTPSAMPRRTPAPAPLPATAQSVKAAARAHEEPRPSQLFDTAASIPAALSHATPPVSACVQVLTGAAAGREVSLTKVVTTLGKPGTAVASITRRHHGFVLAHVEGPERTVLNGTAIGTTSLPLSSGDLIELAGTQMRFLQS